MSLTTTEIDVTVGLNNKAVTPAQSGLTNTMNLQYLINELVTSGGPTGGSGGTLIFPSIGDSTHPSYRFSGSVTVGGTGFATQQPYSIIIRGDGQQQGSAPLLVQTAAADLFIVNMNDGTDDDDAGGVTFQDLMISYSASPPAAGNSGVRVIEKSAGTRLVRVALFNWPVAVNFNQSAECSMIDCRVITNSTAIATIAVQIGDSAATNSAIETYIAGCYFYDNTSMGIGIQIYGCEHLRVVNTRIEQWLTGIAITPQAGGDNAQYMYFENVSCYPYSSTTNTGGPALLITTSGSVTDTKYVFHATFVACELSCPEATTSKPQTGYFGPGVIIGHASGPNDAIDQIRFVDCHVCRWAGPGLQILGGGGSNQTPTNIEVVGGYYSLNGSNTSSGYVSAGIEIVGGTNGPAGVRITGAACNNSLFSPANKSFATATQHYGVYILNAAKSVRVVACDLTGNTMNGFYVNGGSAVAQNLFVRDCDFSGLTTPVYVFGSVTNLQVIDCPGYNDQGTLIASSFPLGSALTIAQLGQYYGPGECYVNAAGAAVKINGHSTSLLNGSFYLEPLETIEIDTSVTNFSAIGK